MRVKSETVLTAFNNTLDVYVTLPLIHKEQRYN